MGVAPSLDLLDAWLNSRYEQVLEAGDWTGIRGRATIQTIGAYQSSTDTVTFTVGSTGVVGLLTTWTSAIIGLRIYMPGDSVIYTVVAVGSTTALTLDRPYEGRGLDGPGVVYAASEYVLMQNIYPLPTDCRAVNQILDAVTSYPLMQFTQAELENTAGIRTLIDLPKSYAEIEDTPEPANGVTIHQVELFPPPRLARGYTVEYLRNANQFNGLNLAQSPLPFVSQSVLVYGVRADIAVWQGRIPQAQAFEAKFQEELTRLLRVEHTQRRAKPTLRMASRFTRHRLARSTRGYQTGWGPGQGGPD